MGIALIIVSVWLIGLVITASILAKLILKEMVGYEKPNSVDRIIAGVIALIIAYFWPVVLLLGGGAWLITKGYKQGYKQES
ncbi:hypothetical protein LCGC14_1973750 [marine sediment metagenome]|uniref:Uncharacterized protein n=1 Tax=marine sediment metagenome TaxID=412755 RepID=A0A0F9FZ53_9ZZZZ